MPNGTLHCEDDAQRYLERLAGHLGSRSRGFSVYNSQIWKPLLRLADMLGLRSKTHEVNGLGHHDVRNSVEIAWMEVIRRDSRVILPLPVPFVSRFVDRWLAPMPFLNWFCVANALVVRKPEAPAAEPPSPSACPRVMKPATSRSLSDGGAGLAFLQRVVRPRTSPR